jgi:hypothetical protein
MKIAISGRRIAKILVVGFFILFAVFDVYVYSNSVYDGIDVGWMGTFVAEAWSSSFFILLIRSWSQAPKEKSLPEAW